MAVDINAELKKAQDKSKTYKTYKEYKEGYNTLKKKSGDSQEPANKAISQPLNNFVKWRKKHTTSSKSLTDELIKQLKELKGSGLETDTFIKRIFVNSLKKVKPEIKNIIIEEVKKSLACSDLQSFQFNTTYYLPVKSVDLFGIFEQSPEDRIGKLFYEVSATTYNTFPYSMNRELYDRTQNTNQTYFSVAGSNYLGTSQQNLFDISYVDSYVDQNAQTIQGSFFKVDIKPRQTYPIVDEFLDDYFSTIDVLDYKTFFTNLVDYVTGSISFGRGDGKLKLSSIQKVLIIMQRILGLCSENNQEIEVGGVSKLSEVDNIDESFYEFNDIDLRFIEQNVSNIKKGVIEFEECDNVQIPMNLDAVLTALDNLKFFEDTSDVNEIDAALGIIYPVVDEDPAYKLSVDSGFFEQFVKAVMNTILSPKTVLPVMVVAGMLNQQKLYEEISNIEDFQKKFKNLFNGILTKISGEFTKAVFNELKREIKVLVKLILGDIVEEKKKKKYLMILSIIAVVPALVKVVKDFTECRSVLDELLQLLNIGVTKKISSIANAGGDIPLPLLLSSKLLDGYSPTRAFLNTVENLEQIGVPTGPMPDGSPNEFLASVKAMIDGNSKEVAENGKVAIGVGALTITPAGITIPKDSYGKFI